MLSNTQHVVSWSFFRGLMAIKRKQLIEFRWRVAKPLAVDDLNHPARLEKSASFGNGGRRANPNRLVLAPYARPDPEKGHSHG
jgi:hypothetical protein